jgi:hypothetical protein
VYSPFGPYPDEEGKVLSPKKKKQPAAKKNPVPAATSAKTAAKKKAQFTLSSSTRQVSC